MDVELFASSLQVAQRLVVVQCVGAEFVAVVIFFLALCGVMGLRMEGKK